MFVHIYEYSANNINQKWLQKTQIDAIIIFESLYV